MSRVLSLLLCALLGSCTTCEQESSKNNGAADVADVGMDVSADAAEDSPPDSAEEDVGLDASDAGTDADASEDVRDSGADAADMFEEPALADGWFATQTVAQRSYRGGNTNGRWHSTTLGVEYFPRGVSPDEICGATLTGYAFVIESASPRWPVTGMDVEVIDSGSTWLQRAFTETMPGVWVVEFADNPIPIEATPIAQRILNVDIQQAADYDEGSSSVTLMARVENVIGCNGITPRLRAAVAPTAWNAMLTGGVLAQPTRLGPADIGPGDSDHALVGLSPDRLGRWTTPTEPRCGDVEAFVATMDRRGSRWKPMTMTVELQDSLGAVVGTYSMTEGPPDQWRSDLNPPLSITTGDQYQLRIYGEEEGERDRFMFRHFWVETSPLSTCP